MFGRDLALKNNSRWDQRDQVGDQHGTIRNHHPVDGPQHHPRREQGVHAERNRACITTAKGLHRLREKTNGGEERRCVTDEFSWHGEHPLVAWTPEVGDL